MDYLKTIFLEKRCGGFFITIAIFMELLQGICIVPDIFSFSDVKAIQNHFDFNVRQMRIKFDMRKN
jgi:hypothetical protein